jgi:hypothetical protein
MSITVSCPSCERTLRVPEKLLGQRVKCPACQETFTASEGGGAPAGVKKSPSGARTAPPPEEYEEEAPPRRARDEEDYDDDYNDRPRRRRRGGGLKPHRGQAIMIMGILSIVGIAWPILGIIAWVMGNSDLKEMRAGRMDPEGESQTRTGRICGMISTLGGASLVLLGCLCWGGLMLMGGLASSGGPH